MHGISLLLKLIFLDIQYFKFKHDHCTRPKPTNLFLSLNVKKNMKKETLLMLAVR